MANGFLAFRIRRQIEMNTPSQPYGAIRAQYDSLEKTHAHVSKKIENQFSLINEGRPDGERSGIIWESGPSFGASVDKIEFWLTQGPFSGGPDLPAHRRFCLTAYADAKEALRQYAGDCVDFVEAVRAIPRDSGLSIPFQEIRAEPDKYLRAFFPVMIGVGTGSDEWKDLIKDSRPDVSSARPDENVRLSNIAWFENMLEACWRLKSYLGHFSDGVKACMDALTALSGIAPPDNAPPGIASATAAGEPRAPAESGSLARRGASMGGRHTALWWERLKLTGKIQHEQVEMTHYIGDTPPDMPLHRRLRILILNSIKTESRQHADRCAALVDDVRAAFEQDGIPLPDKEISLHDWGYPDRPDPQEPAARDGKADAPRFLEQKVKTPLSQWQAPVAHVYHEVLNACLDGAEAVSDEAWKDHMDKALDQLYLYLHNLDVGVRGYVDALKEARGKPAGKSLDVEGALGIFPFLHGLTKRK
jgi:hypothetical protein